MPRAFDGAIKAAADYSRGCGEQSAGGGNASRQIVDVMTPAFPADKLIVVEVYTPGGTGRVIRRINTMCIPSCGSRSGRNLLLSDEQRERVCVSTFVFGAGCGGANGEDARWGCGAGAERISSGGGGAGYDIYYLNFLAGSSRVMAVTEDPQHVWLKATWKETDSRLPMV